MKQYRFCDLVQFIITMIVPMLVFAEQTWWNIVWNICDTDLLYDEVELRLLDFAPAVLIYAITTSHCLHFCKYHRLMMYASLMPFLAYYIVPDDYAELYNAFVVICSIIGLFGFVVTMYRFLKQIVKYVRKITTISRRMRRCN